MEYVFSISIALTFSKGLFRLGWKFDTAEAG